MTRRPTPPPTDSMWASEVACEGRHERVCERIATIDETIQRHERQLITCCGAAGNNGRLGTVSDATKDHEMRLRKLETAVTKGQMIAAGIFAVLSWALHRFGG